MLAASPLPRIIPKASIFKLGMKAVSNPRIKKSSSFRAEIYGVYSSV
jgi:hypothetical protein